MYIVCPDCGADQQEVGKYCENCGRLLTEADAQAAAPAAPAPWNPPASASAAPPPAWTAPAAPPPPWAAPAAGPAAAPAATAHFGVVRNGQADAAQGFTLTHAGEYLVGRPNQETGSGVDVDLRQWVQPLDIGGQKQYLVHRNQCFLGIGADGVVTIRPCPGVETDTLVRPAGQGGFVPLSQLAGVRPIRPNSTFALAPGDQVYMGDPAGVPYFLSGDPTAHDSYVVLELLPS